ncbi:aldo/keto reductase [Fodinicola acaciae]|uniref:aldo/keto reductase n=1 Tax=Fodinicola acaciae TaxID=2681555 RepID=UPI001C9E91BF|nr:aldo/keto reductase [Fodinicola acaciae]
MTRTIGRSGIEVGDIGIGTWAIGGPFHSTTGSALGWGEVDDEESIRMLHRAVELGANLIDTADVYGAGHSETVIGRAFTGRRDDVVIATKWGNTYDEASKVMGPEDRSPEYVRIALEKSLRRLQTDHVDVLQLHVSVPVEIAGELVAACDKLLDEGKIRAYGWSTDDLDRAELFADAHASVIQHELNVLGDAPEMLALCERHDLASFNRSPLAMGLLSDKITADTRIGGADIRATNPEWLRWFVDGRPAPEFLARRDAIREILRGGGRTLAQGALAWNLARSPRTIPLPGCRTLQQVEENLGTLHKAALTAEEMAEIARLSTVD